MTPWLSKTNALFVHSTLDAEGGIVEVDASEPAAFTGLRDYRLHEVAWLLQRWTAVNSHGHGVKKKMKMKTF